MRTPAWVITGLLDSGKTTLINRLVKEELNGLDVLVIQFETGEEKLQKGVKLHKMIFSKSCLEENPFGITGRILKYVRKHRPELILIEWNGMEHFHRLEEMLLQFSAKAAVSVEKVVYVADEAGLQYKIPDAGAAAFSQIAGSDCAFIRTRGHRNFTKDARILLNINPDIRILSGRKWERFLSGMFHFKVQPRHWLLIVPAIAMLYMVAVSLLRDLGVPVERYISVFLGIFLQAVPFLAVGTLLSSLIQVYLPPDWIQQKFPKKVLSGQLFAILAGFCLPVCDCASIPIFKSLVKKGVPLPAAVTFMLVSPVINPVVILSTWYAFNGNYRMIAARCGLGILCALVCGLTWLIKPPKDCRIETAMPVQAGCGDYRLPEKVTNPAARILLVFRHAKNEFFSVGKFLVTGILVSVLFQDLLPRAVASGSGTEPWKALLLMMGTAFVLSLCSSSDAVVARSMAASLPVGAVLGFLVFGPMMDIKNAAMLLSGFKSGFVIRLAVTAFLVCFTGLLLFMASGNGGILL